MSSTLMELQLRRRERRSKNFLLTFTGNEESAAASPVSEELPPPPPPPADPKTPEELAEELAAWIKKMMIFDSLDTGSVDTCGQFTMPSGTSKDAPTIEAYPDLGKLKYTYKGGKNKDKQFHGKGDIEFENGCYMSGEWRIGAREGRFRLDAVEGPVSYLEGFYSNNKLQGRVRVQYSSGAWAIGYAKESVLHGFCRHYDIDKKLQYIGITRNGRLFGTCWKILQDGGCLVGRVDAEGEFTGPNIAYIYPDYRTAFVGIFKNGDMVWAQATQLQGLSIEYNCVKVPSFDQPQGEFFKKEVSTTEWMTENTLLEDPYEQRSVYIAHSKTPGAEEGLFAARDLKCNTIAAFYNGMRKQRPTDSTSTWQLQENAYKIFDPTNKTGVIDILPKYQKLEHYRASLAHKTNHSFLPNCEFSEILHPRWGLVPCVMTREDVLRGDELTVTYGYDLDYCPDWYMGVWENCCVTGGELDPLKSG